MKIREEMSYSQWQKRNSDKFSSLPLPQQKEVRQQGYYNVGWERVIKSWQLLGQITNKVVSLFEHQLNKGELVAAINLSILESERTKQIAQDGRQELDKIQQHLDNLADEVLAKYTLL